MITIQTQSDGVLFNFQDSTRYLYGDGSILTPYNSLTLIADESNVLTFRKSASNDIFITAGYDELGYSSKEEAINDLKTKLFKATGGSESGITSGDVETMIDAALADYYTDDEVDAALSGKQDALRYYTEDSDGLAQIAVGNGYLEVYDGFAHLGVGNTELKMDTSGISVNDESVATQPYVAAALSGLAPESAVTALDSILTAHTADTGIHVSQLEKDAWNAKLDASAYTPTDLSNYYTSAQTEAAIEAATSGKADTSAVTAVNDALTAHTANTTVHVTSAEKTAWNAKQDALYVYTEDNNLGTAELHSNDSSIIFNAGGASITAMGVNTFNVASTGVTINGENVLTDGIISTAITSGSTDAQVPSAKAVYDATQSGGGGATYSAGTNISIDTANTINCTLPISVTGRYLGKSLILTNGNGMAAEGACSIIAGNQVNANQNASFGCAVGSWLNIKNEVESSFGVGNNSVTGSTASGQTLFSVGNGTSSARHNAFEIRKNGDIYITSGGTDIKLQDNLGGGGGGSVTVDSELYMNSSNPVENQVIAQAIEDIFITLDGSYNDGTPTVNFKRISQSDYDDLLNGIGVDYDTLYIITPDEENDENDGGE